VNASFSKLFARVIGGVHPPKIWHCDAAQRQRIKNSFKDLLQCHSNCN